MVFKEVNNIIIMNRFIIYAAMWLITLLMLYIRHLVINEQIKIKNSKKIISGTNPST